MNGFGLPFSYTFISCITSKNVSLFYTCLDKSNKSKTATELGRMKIVLSCSVCVKAKSIVLIAFYVNYNIDWSWRTLFGVVIFCVCMCMLVDERVCLFCELVHEVDILLKGKRNESRGTCMAYHWYQLFWLKVLTQYCLQLCCSMQDFMKIQCNVEIVSTPLAYMLKSI